MPIYAYRCSACGHARDVLQKLSDPLLTVCPSCGQASFAKQVTAAGFQLKGSGWYVTDFRDGGKGAKAGAEKGGDKPASEPASAGGDKAPAVDGAGKNDTASPAPAAASPAVSPSPPAPTAGG